MRALETSISPPQTNRILGWTRSRKWVQNNMRALEISLSRIQQVAFWAGQEEENEFPVPGDYLKHRFLDLTKVEFWAYQEGENDF